jgi:uncharacterized protein YkwD
VGEWTGVQIFVNRGAFWVLRLGATALLACLPAAAGSVDTGTGERVLQALQSARREAGAKPLARRVDLDTVARERAEQLAELPQSRRLSHSGEAAGQHLRRVGIAYRRVALHVDFNRGYTDPEARFVSSWSDYRKSWNLALEKDFDGVGMATARASDGWFVLVAVLIEERPVIPRPDPLVLEVSTVEAVNQARAEHGLEPLTVNPVLVQTARDHSRDMARRGYFDHRSPAGDDVQDRVLKSKIDYSRIGENLHMNRGSEDPVRTAVESWLKSLGHREHLLSPEFRETGIGVAIDDEGAIYFTQLFLVPAR